GCPEMAEIIDDLGLAGCAREDKRGPLPIGQNHSVVFQNLVRRRYLTYPLASARRRIGVAGENARSGDGVGPVLRAAENAAQCAHRSSFPLLCASPTPRRP